MYPVQSTFDCFFLYKLLTYFAHHVCPLFSSGYGHGERFVVENSACAPSSKNACGSSAYVARRRSSCIEDVVAGPIFRHVQYDVEKVGFRTQTTFPPALGVVCIHYMVLPTHSSRRLSLLRWTLGIFKTNSSKHTNCCRQIRLMYPEASTCSQIGDFARETKRSVMPASRTYRYVRTLELLWQWRFTAGQQTEHLCLYLHTCSSHSAQNNSDAHCAVGLNLSKSSSHWYGTNFKQTRDHF